MFQIPNLPGSRPEIIHPEEPVTFIRDWMAVMGTGTSHPLIQTWPLLSTATTFEPSTYRTAAQQEQDIRDAKKPKKNKNKNKKQTNQSRRNNLDNQAARIKSNAVVVEDDFDKMLDAVMNTQSMNSKI